MENSENNKQAANGAGPSGSTSSGEFSFNPPINHNIASHSVSGSPHHPLHIDQSNPIPFSGSVNAATGTASSFRSRGILPYPYMSPQGRRFFPSRRFMSPQGRRFFPSRRFMSPHGRRILPSSPCNSPRGRSSSSSPPNSIRGRINSSSIPCKSSHPTRPVEVGQGNGGLELIENIADGISPAEVRHLLFEGLPDGHITRPLLHSNIGRNVRHSSPFPPQFSDSTRINIERL